MSSLVQTVARNSAATLLGQLAVKLLSFGFSVVVVRHLGAEVYGQYAAVLAFGATFVFLGDLGLSPYLVREVARARSVLRAEQQIGDLVANVLALRLLLSTLAGGLLVLVAIATGRPEAMVIAIAIGALGLIVYAVHGTCDSTLAGYERFDLTASARVLYQVVFVALGTLVLVLGWGYHGLMVAGMAGALAMTALCWRAIHRRGLRLGRPVAAEWATLLRASWPFGVVALTLGLSYRFDSVLLNLTRSDAETGYYNAAYNLVFSAALLSNALNTTLFPSLTRQAMVDVAALPQIVERALRYLLILGLPIAVGGTLLADGLIDLLYSSAYLPSAGALTIVIWAVPLMFVSEFLGYVALVVGDERRVARAVLVSTACNISLNLLLLPRIGFLAAAATTVATEIVLVAQYAWLMRVELRRMDLASMLGRPLAAAAVLGLSVWLARELPTLVVVPIGAATYLVAVVATRAITGSELQTLVQIGRHTLVATRARSRTVEAATVRAGEVSV